jgi:transcriptional repressor NrdR
LDSRDTDENRAIRRRRECEACGFRFTTFERVELTNFIVVKKDGAREAYDRDKLLRGIWKSCEKRPVSEEQVNTQIAKLEDKWRNFGKEVPSIMIGEDIMNALKAMDEVAYIRFASVYRHFKDIESFRDELSKLIEKQ